MYVPQFERPEDFSPKIFRFPTPEERRNADGPDTSKKITLDDFYQEWVLPELGNRSSSTLSLKRTAVKHWQRIVGDVDIRDVNRRHLELFRNGLLLGRAPATVNAVWRNIRIIFSVAQDRGLIARIPSIALGMKLRLVDEPPKIQRPPITDEEVLRLWHACSHATYPADTIWPAPILWRVALLLFWMYGQRTRDVFCLTYENVQYQERLLQFQAMKTRKVQGLPLTETVTRHLKALQRPHSVRVLPGFQQRGGFRRDGLLRHGYADCWNREICANAKLERPIKLKDFRVTAVTRYNGIEPNLGAWIAGHYMPGVTAQFYDQPSQRIREAIESTPLPECFTWDVV